MVNLLAAVSDILSRSFNIKRCLLSYDPLDFYAYLETIVATYTPSSDSLFSQTERPPWLTTDAAHTIISVAKQRCYVENYKSPEKQSVDGFEAEWEVLDEIERTSTRAQSTSHQLQNIEPVLEEPPKWSLLVDVLAEIEQLMNDNPGLHGAFFN